MVCFCDCNICALHESQERNEYRDATRNPDGPRTHTTFTFELCKKNRECGCAPYDPGKNMGLDRAAKDCANIGNECHKSERNSNDAQDFFVWYGSDDFIRLTTL